MSIDAGSTERASIIRTLRRFTLMCTLGEDETLSHAQNQKILYNYGNHGDDANMSCDLLLLGVMSDVINYVIHTSKTVSMEMVESSDSPKHNTSLRSNRRTMRGFVGTPGGADIPSVFVECFRFLKALTRDNIIVQRR